MVFGLGRGLGFFHRSVGLSVGKEFLLLFLWIVLRTHKNFEALPSWLCSIVLIFGVSVKIFFFTMGLFPLGTKGHYIQKFGE